MDGNVIGDRISGIEEGVAGIEDQREVLGRRLEALETRLLARFSALDALVAQLQNTGSFLTQHLESLSTISARSK